MPTAEHIAVNVGGIALHQARGPDVFLGALPGVQVIVLLRHRH